MKKFVFSLLPLIFLSGCSTTKLMDHDSILKLKLNTVPLTPYHWQVEYDGGGLVQFNPDGSGDIILRPQSPKASGQTFAALLLLKDTLDKPLKNYVAKIEVTTVQQLRETVPNEWEVFWFFGNYVKGTKAAKTTNYVMVKPTSGVELGRAFDEVGQEFLKTTNLGVLQIGKRHTLIVVKQGSSWRLFMDGKDVLTYHGANMPQALYDQAGTFGLYTEDALVRIHSFSYQAL